MKSNLIAVVGVCLCLFQSAGARTPGSPWALNPIEQTAQMKSLRTELNAALASGDRGRIKAVEDRIQAAYLATQPPALSYVNVEPVPEPPSCPASPGPDVMIAPGPVGTFATAFTPNGVMYVGASLPDSTVRVFRSLDHGQTWTYLMGVHHYPDYICPKVDLVVTTGDSAKVFLFFMLDTSYAGDVYCVRTDTNGANLQFLPVLVGNDTIGDFAFCADPENHYYLYGCAYSTVKTYGANGKLLRSTDYGRTWAVTQNYGDLNEVSLQNGAGAWQYMATAIRTPGNKGTIILTTNHNYGDPLYWHEYYLQPDTFVVNEPVLCPAYTLPETSALIRAVWCMNETTGAETGFVRTTYSQDGGASYTTPGVIPVEFGAGQYWPDLQTSHVLGDTYVDVSYVSYKGGFRRVFRRYSRTTYPGIWSDTVRIASEQAYRSHLVKPRLIYSSGGPSTHAGCAFVTYMGWNLAWNAPWLSAAIGEAPAGSTTSCLNLSRNPARASVTLAWSGAARSLAIYDAAGRVVRSFNRPPGNCLTWNLTDARGARVSAGVYLVRVTTGRAADARMLVVE